MKIKKLLTIAFVGLLMNSMFVSCTDDFLEYNTNERVLTELDAASIGNLFARVQYMGYYMGYHQTSQNLFADHYCQYFANTQNAFPQDRYVLVGGWLNGAWRQFYGTVPNNLGEVLDLTNPEEFPERASMHAIAQIMRVVMYERIANYWGPIPYFNVNNAEATVPYDGEEEIYKSFFTTLDAAMAILTQNTGGNAYGGNDQIFNGDIDKWIKFGNTLRLRLALRISNVEPNLAETEAKKAVSGGVMLTNDDDASIKTTPNSINGMNRYTPWNEFRMSAAMESVMVGYDDPRISGFFTPNRETYDEEYIDYIGPPLTWTGLRNGYEIVDLQGKPELNVNKLAAIGPRWFDVNLKDSNPRDIMQSAEAYFLRAEGVLKSWTGMGGTAEELYNLGIEKSLMHWGITDPAVIAAYQQSAAVPVSTHDAPNPVSDIPVKFDADPAVALEQVATQKWLGLFPDGWEGWADVRRRDLPKMYDRMVSENAYVAANEMMRRVEYVSSEYETNGDAVADAITKLGGPDNGATRLWWNPAN